MMGKTKQKYFWKSGKKSLAFKAEKCQGSRKLVFLFWNFPLRFSLWLSALWARISARDHSSAQLLCSDFESVTPTTSSTRRQKLSNFPISSQYSSQSHISTKNHSLWNEAVVPVSNGILHVTLEILHRPPEQLAAFVWQKIILCSREEFFRMPNFLSN